MQRFCRFEKEEAEQLGEAPLRPRRRVEPTRPVIPHSRINEDIRVPAGAARRRGRGASSGSSRPRRRSTTRTERTSTSSRSRLRPIRRSRGSWTTASTATSRSRRPSSLGSTSPRSTSRRSSSGRRSAIHDYETKKGHVVRFLNQRAKVKVTIMFRGRETTPSGAGTRPADAARRGRQGDRAVESPPLLDGRNMVMMLGPTKNAGVTRDAKAEDDTAERRSGSR